MATELVGDFGRIFIGSRDNDGWEPYLLHRDARFSYMNLWGDLKSPGAMYLKAALFCFGGVGAAAGILARNPDPRTLFLLVVLVWSFCRLYYFLFYVIERYIDPSYRFDGVFSAVRYLMKRGKTGATEPSDRQGE